MIGPDESLQRRRAAIGLGCVLLAVLCVWLRSLGGEFVYDDNLLIRRNPALTELANWPAVVGRGMWAFLDAHDARHLGYWRPLAGTVLLVTNVLGHNSPLAFHWAAILLHLAATAAAFALARELTRELAGSLPIALLTALLFGLHPAHVESVAWISALNDPLFAIFAFLALRSWIRWRKAGSEGAPWSAGALLLLALLAKELAAAVVPLALCYDLATARKAGPLRAWLPFALAGLAWYAGRVAVFGELAAGFDRTTTFFGVGPGRLAQLRVELLGGYTWLGLWPADLKLFHPFRPTLSGSDPQFLRALACSAGLIGAITWAWKREQRTLAFALAFLPVSILPALVRVESLGISPLAERYLYLGTFGFVFAFAWCAWTWLPRSLALVACLVVGALYSLKSVARTAFWHDEMTLFRTLHEQTPEVPEAHWGLGRVLLERYRKTGAVGDLNEANKAFWSGLDLISRAQKGDGSIFATVNDHIQTNMGVGWCELYRAELEGDMQNGAEDAFRQVVKRYPESDQALVGLAAALTFSGKLDEAQKSLREALAKNERNIEAHHNLGLVLLSLNDLDGACKEIGRALELRPGHLDDMVWLARIRMQQGKEQEAREWIARARVAQPDSTTPLVLEATLAAQHSETERALKLVDQALDRNGDDGEALLLKGKLHHQLGQDNSARQALTRACELLPTSFEANYNMGELTVEKAPDDAIPYLVRAYELRAPDGVAEPLRKQLLSMKFSSAHTPVTLAQTDLARGNVPGASEWAAKAQAIEPQSGEVHQLLGVIAQRRGAFDEAERELLEACRLLPASLDAHLGLAEVYVALNKTGDARRTLEKLLGIVQRQGTGVLQDELIRQEARSLLDQLGK